MIPTRTINAKRGRVFSAVLGGALLIVGLVAGYGNLMALHHDISEILACGLISVGGLAVVVTGWTQRIAVDQNGIKVGSCWKTRTMPWGDLDYSASYVLAEPEHPLGIRLYGYGDEKARITLGLKTYSKTDVTWMLRELPLKIREVRRGSLDDDSMPEPNGRNR